MASKKKTVEEKIEEFLNYEKEGYGDPEEWKNRKEEEARQHYKELAKIKASKNNKK